MVNNQTSPSYQNKELTGAGVALQFCRAYDLKHGWNWWYDFLDLAALGVDGDMGSGLSAENQWLWQTGFNRIQNPLFCALMEKQAFSMKGVASPISVAFYITPLINAVIRCGTNEEKENLFLAFIDGNEMVESGKRGSFGELVPRAEEMARQCANIRSRQNKVLEQAEAKIEDKIVKNGLLENRVLFIELEEDDVFPSELNGLLAMRCAARHKHPTIVARRNREGFVRGSGRGLAASELKDFREFLLGTGLFEYASGHSNAFGASLLASRVEEFISVSNKELANFDFNESFYDVNFRREASAWDLEALICEIGEASYIWATLNPEPLIHITNLNLKESDIAVIGKNKDTLRWTKNGITYLVFNAKDKMGDFLGHGLINVEVVGKANLNEWGGRTTAQILVDNYEVKSNLFEF